MEYLRIIGGRALHGSLQVQGAKNAVLPILAATLLSGGRCTLYNCPALRDVHTALEILRALGCEAALEDGVARVDCNGRSGTALSPETAGQMRASILFLGALLAAAGEADVPLPGGCALGARPLDLHLQALSSLGAQVRCEGDVLRCSGRLHGGTVLLRYPSVGATENLMLAACAASGPVTILGAAREPEIADLAAFLNACGACVDGAGSATVRITPQPMHGCTYSVMPDRIAAATWLCAAAATGGSLELTNAVAAHLTPVLAALRSAGCEIDTDGAGLRLRAGPLRAVAPIVTGPYPAFPTDAQPPLMAALLRAEGTSVFDETVFEDRYRHVPALRALGASIDVAGRVASVRGVSALYGAPMTATDLRGGAAMLIAALAARGESRLYALHHLRRGYASLPADLTRLGAQVAPCTEEPDPR